MSRSTNRVFVSGLYYPATSKSKGRVKGFVYKGEMNAMREKFGIVKWIVVCAVKKWDLLLC